MKHITALIILISLMIATPVFAGWDANEGEQISEEKEMKVEDTIAFFKEKDPDLNNFFKKAYGYAVFPTVGKGGIGIGGAYGKGVVYEKGKAIGNTSLTQVSYGLQLGGQAYSEIIFFKDIVALEAFTQGGFTLSAGVSAVALTAGASADTDYSEGVAVFTMARGGLMYEATVSGQKFSFTAFE